MVLCVECQQRCLNTLASQSIAFSFHFTFFWPGMWWTGQSVLGRNNVECFILRKASAGLTLYHLCAMQLQITLFSDVTFPNHVYQERLTEMSWYTSSRPIWPKLPSFRPIQRIVPSWRSSWRRGQHSPKLGKTFYFLCFIYLKHHQVITILNIFY